jgi:hypothetical protein
MSNEHAKPCPSKKPPPPIWGRLERKGLCTKQDLYDIITEFRSKTPRAASLKPTRSVLRLD